MSSQGNRGKLDLQLFTVEGKRVSDSNAHLKMFKFVPNLEEQEIFSEDVPLIKGELISLPAFPQVKEMFCRVTTTRFRETDTPVFTVLGEEPTVVEVELLRKPEKWQPHFIKYDDLPAGFNTLKDVLDQSPDIKVRFGDPIKGNFVGETYDAVKEDSKQSARAAKEGLLNLYTKMTNLIEPVGKQKDWFSHVVRILEIAQSRMIALVKPEMAGIIQKMRDDIGDFDDYERAIAKNHFGNMPVKFGVKRDDMFSIKSSDSKGNLQLTLGPGKDNGQEVLVLDADIDESGTLLAHLSDVIKHKITKMQTDPLDVHEFIKREIRKAQLEEAEQATNLIPLGYDLV